MGFNKIQIDGHPFDGHQFVGGGYTLLTAATDINSSSPYSTTIPHDGILCISSSKTGTGYSANIYINGVNCFPIFFGDGISIEPQTCVVQFPVKKDDALRITTDLPSSSTQTWRIRVQVIKYR